MNIKLHTPKSLQAGSGMATLKQFVLSLVATTISIVLTFGTAALVDYSKKESQKKEMVKTLLYDFDQTIAMLEKNDTILAEARRLELEVAQHPEYFDSLRFQFVPALALCYTKFPETTEKIFTSNIETLSTIGDVNFVSEVSQFYIDRQRYVNDVINKFSDLVNGEENGLSSPKVFFAIDFNEFHFLNWDMLQSMKGRRDRCMKMMDISEADMREFSKNFVVEERGKEDAEYLEKLREMAEGSKILLNARKRFKNEE